MLITAPLSKALGELKRNAELPYSSLAREHPELLPTFRTAAIKSFEYVYELSVKLVRRALESKAASPGEVDGLDFKVLMRTAAEKGLIDDPVSWFLFREKRNITSHTYDETKAIDVLAILPQFIERAQNLLERLDATEPVHR